ncbi:MAG: hypothetical protein AB2385_04480 [Symbiobacterium sp.]|uniref:hypothetical protein n=1 Tax=Symbiobacterium sp. TaxID=1971213 RepID=UPI0034638E81
MQPDPRVTPRGDTVSDRPVPDRLTAQRLAGEVAAELGIDLDGDAAAGLDPGLVRRYEAETHSPDRRAGH